MTNPINEAIQVNWGPKQYLCDLTLGQLALVEGELDIAIVYPAAKMLWQKPEAYQRGVILYAMLKPHGIELADCMEAATGSKREYFAKKITRGIERLQPVLHELWGIAPEVKPSAPLDGASGGPICGPALESTLE